MSGRHYDIEVITGPEGRCLAVGERGTGASMRVAGPKPWGGDKVEHKFMVAEADLLEALSDDRPALLTLRKRAADILERRQHSVAQLKENSKERAVEEGVVAAWQAVIDLIDAQPPMQEENDGRAE